jgi:hypothetical protein
VRISEKNARSRTLNEQQQNERDLKAFMAKMQIEYPEMPGKEMVPYIKFQSLQ